MKETALRRSQNSKNKRGKTCLLFAACENRKGDGRVSELSRGGARSAPESP